MISFQKLLLAFLTFILVLYSLYELLRAETHEEFVRRVYRGQEDLIAKKARGDPETEQHVFDLNSGQLPQRAYSNYSFAELCVRRPELCASPTRKTLTSIAVVPEHKVASCLVQKSASTIISGALCYLKNETYFVESGRDIMKEYGSVSLCREMFAGSFNDLKEQYKPTEDWKFLFIKREPVDRFLSGFIDMCIQQPLPECFGCRHNLTCFLERIVERSVDGVVQAVAYSSDSSSLTPEEVHTFPQTWQCELAEHLANYTTIEFSIDPAERLLPSLEEVLRSQQVPEESIGVIHQAFTSKRSAHSTVRTRFRAILENRLRSEPYLMELLVRLLYHDFVKLGFPFPA